MSFLKQYRVNLCLMSIIGLTPFIGFCGNRQTIRVFVPFMANSLFLIMLVPILTYNYTHQIIRNSREMHQYSISVFVLAQFTYLIILVLMYITIVILSISISRSHVGFLHAIESFHESVCALNSKNDSWFIYRLVAESILCNVLWSAALLHMVLQIGSFLDAFVNSFPIFANMTFMFHIRSLACLLGNDLKTIRCSLSSRSLPAKNGLIHKDPSFVLFEKFLSIKQLFESVFGKILALCAVFDLVILVVVVYMFTMFFIAPQFSWHGLIEGSLGYLFPLVIKNVMLTKACAQIANEVNI